MSSLSVCSLVAVVGYFLIFVAVLMPTRRRRETKMVLVHKAILMTSQQSCTGVAEMAKGNSLVKRVRGYQMWQSG